MPAGYKQRTDAEREAINERARNWKRPPAALSERQCGALAAMALGELIYTVAGFNGDVGGYHSSQTVLSLAQRGLCSVAGAGKHRRARITAAGRREIAR
jgi:hypothetical protein